MKIKLLQLHSEPEIFKPIIFHDGINLIMGEKVEDSAEKKAKKTNGVGKTLSIEFLNYCLLKSAEHSRVSKIPIDKLPEDVKIILDLEINFQRIQIVRTRGKAENPIIIKDGIEIEFENIDDATQYIKELLFVDFNFEVDISFREFMAPFLREEGSEFKDILMCYDSTMNVPPSIKANAFIFGLDISLVEEIKKDLKELEKFITYQNKIKSLLTEDGRKKISDIKSTINSLKDGLKKIDNALEGFQTNEAYESQQEELSKYQYEIDELRSKQSAFRYELKIINSFPSMEMISEKEVEIVYNQFKAGLGTIVAKSIQEVKGFKQKIDNFQRRLYNEKITTLNDELIIVTKRLKELEDKKIALEELIDQKGVLKDFRTGYAIYHKKRETYENITSQYSSFEKCSNDIKRLRLKKDGLFIKLDALLAESKSIIESFNSTILEIHEYIMESSEASFDIKTVNSGKSKMVLLFEMRIDDDRSHSVDRAKVFIYDLALLYNEYTSKRHPQLLIHDNIFDVDQDTLIKSLNYLVTKESSDFQYILTLNRDKVENEEREKELLLNIETHSVANYTKKERFLFGDKYTEV